MREATVQAAGAASAEWEAVRPHLDAEVERLPAKLREAVVRHFFAGRSHAELAEELGVPRATAASRVQLGLECLRAGLTRRGVTLGLAALGPALLANAQAAAPAALLASLPALTSGAVAAGAAALAEGVLKMMFWMKLKVAATVLGGVALVGGGAVAVKLAAGEPAATPVSATAPAPAAANQSADLKSLPPNQWVEFNPKKNAPIHSQTYPRRPSCAAWTARATSARTSSR